MNSLTIKKKKKKSHQPTSKSQLACTHKPISNPNEDLFRLLLALFCFLAFSQFVFSFPSDFLFEKRKKKINSFVQIFSLHTFYAFFLCILYFFSRLLRNNETKNTECTTRVIFSSSISYL